MTDPTAQDRCVETDTLLILMISVPHAQWGLDVVTKLGITIGKVLEASNCPLCNLIRLVKYI